MNGYHPLKHHQDDKLQTSASVLVRDVATKEEIERFNNALENRFIGTVSLNKTYIRRAEGCVMWDEKGQRVLDFTSGQLSAFLGHSHPEILATIIAQASQLDHLLSFSLNDPAINLAEGLMTVVPSCFTRFQFVSTGSETVELALRMAKLYTGGWEVVALSTAYHGLSQGAAGPTYVLGRQGYGPIIGNFALPTPNPRVSTFRNENGEYDWKAEMLYNWDLIDKQSTGNLACVIFEPILSAGGMVELPTGYMKELSIQAKKRGMLVICDEAVTGMGRTGDMFAFQKDRDGFIPDILLLSKTIGAGLPLGAIITTNEIDKKCREKGLFYVTTHMNDPIPCAVGAKVVEIVKRDGLADEARRKGEMMRSELKKIQSKHPVIADIRGRGLMIGVELGPLPNSTMSALQFSKALSDRCLEIGVSITALRLEEGSQVFRILPPMIITDEEIREGLGKFGEAIEWAVNEFTSVPIDGSMGRVESSVGEWVPS